MNYLKLAFKSNKKYLKIFFFFFIVGSSLGLIYYNILDKNLLTSSINNIPDILSTKHLNFIFSHLMIIFCIFASIFLGIGIIITLFYFLFIGLTTNLIILAFWSLWHFKGLIYSCFYLIITKLLFFCFLIYFFKIVINLSKELFNLFKNNSFFNSENLKLYLKRFIVITILIIINDVFIFFFGTKILEKLTFIIK